MLWSALGCAYDCFKIDAMDGDAADACSHLDEERHRSRSDSVSSFFLGPPFPRCLFVETFLSHGHPKCQAFCPSLGVKRYRVTEYDALSTRIHAFYARSRSGCVTRRANEKCSKHTFARQRIAFAVRYGSQCSHVGSQKITIETYAFHRSRRPCTDLEKEQTVGERERVRQREGMT